MMFPPFKGFVRFFVIACTSVFVLQMFAAHGALRDLQAERILIQFFGLQPQLVFKGMIYQLVTWIFIHGSLFHLLFNMFAFWMFGSLLESFLGQRIFLRFFFASAIGSACIIILFSLVDDLTYSVPTIGASGVVFAILIAVARLFPNQTVLFFFIFPMKMKYFALLILALEFYALYTSNNHGISNIAHLGGALVGFLFVSWLNRTGGRGLGGKGIRLSWRALVERLQARRKKKHLRIVYPEDRTRYH